MREKRKKGKKEERREREGREGKKKEIKLPREKYTSSDLKESKLLKEFSLLSH